MLLGTAGALCVMLGLAVTAQAQCWNYDQAQCWNYDRCGDLGPAKWPSGTGGPGCRGQQSQVRAFQSGSPLAPPPHTY